MFGRNVEMKNLDGPRGNNDLPPGEYVVPDGHGGSGDVRRKFDTRCLEWKCRLRPEDLCDLGLASENIIHIRKRDGELTRCSARVNQFVRMLSTGVR